jgi:pyruvate-formate lyase
VISLGIYGLRKRVSEYAEKNAKDPQKTDFYRNVLRVYDAALRWMRRAADTARLSRKDEMADALIGLCEREPRNLYEALQTSLVYYHLQQFFDGSILRTLGRLDRLFYPYYVKEDRGAREKMLLDYIDEIDRLEAAANIPFALGGTDEDGDSLVNEMSYAWLDAYGKRETVNTKLHLLCSKRTPSDIIENNITNITFFILLTLQF